MAKISERYGDLFDSLHDNKDEWRDTLMSTVDKPTKRYGNLFRRFGLANTQSYDEVSAMIKSNSYTDISIADCITYLNAAKTKIGELESVGTYQATQESKSIKSDFAELVERMLKNKYFAIGKVNGKFVAFIFDTSEKRDRLIAANPQDNLTKAYYYEFIIQAKIGHKAISNYYSSDECLVFQI